MSVVAIFITFSIGDSFKEVSIFFLEFIINENPVTLTELGLKKEF